MTISIPFNRPCLAGNEYKYIAQAIANGHASGDGPFTRRCHELLEQELGVAKVLLTTSCTHALEMAAILLDCGPGDEVIMPSFTFVSTANAFVLRGARIVFCDIRPDTLNLDETRLEGLITSRTKAIVPGALCRRRLRNGHHRRRLPDATAPGSLRTTRTHSLLATRESTPELSDALATQSFHETKNVTCGEGGALVVNDRDLVERALIIREKGTNRSQFFRGQVDKYTWVDIGSSYLPSDLLAAFLLAQLEGRQEIQRKRQRIWESYRQQFEDWARQRDVRLPVVPAECEQAFHMFYLILPSLEYRQGLIAHLKAQGILSVFHYVPLNLSEMGQKWAAGEARCPVTEDISLRLLRLPFYNDLTEAEQARVVAAVTSFEN